MNKLCLIKNEYVPLSHKLAAIHILLLFIIHPKCKGIKSTYHVGIYLNKTLEGGENCLCTYFNLIKLRELVFRTSNHLSE